MAIGRRLQTHGTIGGTKEIPMKLKVLVRPEAEGGFSVSVPAMAGCHSQGENLEEALANIREAADLWIEVVAERAAREALSNAPQSEVQEIEL
jgi:predicted RNase H-like HicB family nuclease